MKYNSIAIKKILILSIFFMFLIPLLICNVYAYQITYRLTPKEELGQINENTPTNFIYRKQVSAYSDTITKYNNGVNGSSDGYDVNGDGWVYASSLHSNYPEDNLFTGINNDPHSKPLSFERIYEYFHKNQNSEYRTDYAEGWKTRYYSTGEIGHTNELKEFPMTAKEIWNVWGESSKYRGIYSSIASESDISQLRSDFQSSDDILIMDNNLYRFAVINNTFISDNIITSTTIDKLWDMFGEENSSKELNVYGSSVLRTSSSCAKNGEPYYQNMDTAYKFWETTIRGNTERNISANSGKLSAREAWYNSPSTTGINESGDIQSSRSVINYYDNTYVIPKGNLPIKVYVRHIDVSNIDDIKAENINNSLVLKENTQIIEVSRRK